RIGMWRPDPQGGPVQDPVLSTGDLRLLASDVRLQTATLDPSSILRAADVDGDQVLDLVALLKFALPAPGPGEGDALLVVLRGRTAAGPGELPFQEPLVGTPVHGLATSFALGDFAPDGSRRLELALAVPLDADGGTNGNHVRFFRVQAGSTPGDLHWQRSFSPGGAEVLLAGNGPTQLAAS